MPPKTCISYRMIPSKLAFLFYDTLYGLYGVYLVLILTSFGLSVKEAGFIAGFRCIVAFICTPFIGWAADYTKRPDIVFIGLGISIITTLLPLPWIVVALPSTHLEPFHSSLFYVMFILTCVTTTCMNPMRGFIDSFVMKVISASNSNESFGTQSLFGAVGIMVINPFCGLLLDWYQPRSLSKFSGAIFLLVAISVLITPVGYVLAKQTNVIQETVKKEDEKSMFIAFKEVFMNISNQMYLMSVFIIGLCATGFNSYYFKLMKDQMNAGNVSMGLSYGVAGFGEIIIFLNGERIMNKIGSPINGLLISLFAHALRFLLFAIITNVWLTIPVQLLNGFTFALFFLSAAKYTYQIADEKIYNSVFLIEISCYLNAGGFVSNFLGGYIYGDYGGSVLFLGFCSLASVWVVLMVVYFVLLKLCNQLQC